MQSPSPYENQAPQLVSQTHYCVMGDVTVAADALIAPGVVLQASPGSRIVVSSGACLAGGVCIQSRKGMLTIGAGANLGANVLLVGCGSIGAGACISPGSTLMNPQVPEASIVPPSALMVSAVVSTAQQATARVSPGQVSAGGFASGFTASFSSFSSEKSVSNSESPVTVSQESDSFVNTFVEPPPVGPRPIETPSLSDQNGQYIDPTAQVDDVQLSNGSASNGFVNGQAQNVGDFASNGSTANSSAPNSSALSVANSQHVYGKEQITQLLSTLFPNRAL